MHNAFGQHIWISALSLAKQTKYILYAFISEDYFTHLLRATDRVLPSDLF